MGTALEFRAREDPRWYEGFMLPRSYKMHHQAVTRDPTLQYSFNNICCGFLK